MISCLLKWKTTLPYNSNMKYHFVINLMRMKHHLAISVTILIWKNYCRLSPSGNWLIFLLMNSFDFHIKGTFVWNLFTYIICFRYRGWIHFWILLSQTFICCFISFVRLLRFKNIRYFSNSKWMIEKKKLLYWQHSLTVN